MKLKALLNDPPPRPVVSRAIEILSALPTGEVLGYGELAKALRVSISSLYQVALHPKLRSFRIRIRKSVYWGNRKTIESA